MTETKIADGATWHKSHKPLKPIKKEAPQIKPKSRLDLKFEEWAKKNGVNLRDLKIMEKKNVKGNNR